MPIYEFLCPTHGLFDVFTRMGGSPDEATCGRAGCSERGSRVFSAPALVNVKRDWNEKANEYQRDPYTQAKAQLRNVDRGAQERGDSPAKITEEGIQVAAAGLEKSKRPRRGIESRALEPIKRRAAEVMKAREAK